MAYNPDEIAKVKHLNEFARQLNTKLDGGTDPKLTFPNSISTSVWSDAQQKNVNVAVLNVDNIDVNLKTWSGSKMSFTFYFYPATASQGVAQHSQPYLKKISSTGSAEWSQGNAIHYRIGVYLAGWSLAVDCEEKQPCDLTLTFGIDETPAFLRFRENCDFPYLQ